MKKILFYIVSFICLCSTVDARTLGEIYADNAKQIRAILDSFVGRSEQDIISYMGVPSAYYNTEDYKYLEYVTHKYKSIENGAEYETDCKILIKLSYGFVVSANPLNGHNYCFDGSMLDLGGGFK